MSKIEWCDYTINPVRGKCPVGCSYCYARRLYDRFKWDPTIRFEDVFWYPGIKGKPGDKYFVGSTMELFGPWIEDWWMENTFIWVNAYPQRTFIFLTKRPEGLFKWSPFPDNVWVGVTATDASKAWIASKHLSRVEAPVKFLSIEPLLSWETSTPYTTENIVAGLNGSLDLLIIGRQTPVSRKTEPKIEDLREIVDAADKAGIKVFLKNNLYSLLKHEQPFVNYKSILRPEGELRQELPTEV